MGSLPCSFGRVGAVYSAAMKQSHLDDLIRDRIEIKIAMRSHPYASRTPRAMTMRTVWRNMDRSRKRSLRPALLLPLPLPLLFLLLWGGLGQAPPAVGADPKLDFRLRRASRPRPASGRYQVVERAETWEPKQTAIIVCDMWDYHHCLNAVRRGQEMTPRMEHVLKTARDRGVQIIHAPSGCMDAYRDHPARVRARNPTLQSLPAEIGKWCYKIPAEEKGTYPIDQSNGGEDDDPAEHAAWAAKLTAMGRNPKASGRHRPTASRLSPKRT